MRTRAEVGFDAADEGDHLVVDGLIHHSAFPVVLRRLSTWPVSKNFSRSYSSTAITTTTGRPCLATTLLVGPKGLPVIGPTAAALGAPERSGRNHLNRQARQLFPARPGSCARCIGLLALLPALDAVLRAGNVAVPPGQHFLAIEIHDDFALVAVELALVRSGLKTCVQESVVIRCSQPPYPPTPVGHRHPVCCWPHPQEGARDSGSGGISRC